MRTASNQAEANVDSAWWVRYPEVCRSELDGLKAAGLGWEDDPLGDGDLLRFAGWVSIPAGSPITAGTRAADGPVRLRAVYPSSFPWFPPHLWDVDRELPWLVRHVGLGDDRALCLVHDRDWQPGMTLADLLVRQVPLMLRTGDPDAEQLYDRSDLERWEMPLPDPGQNGVQVTAGWSILVDSACQLPAGADGGRMSVEFFADPLVARPNTVGCLLNVHADGQRIETTDVRLTPILGYPVAGQWLRLAAPPTGTPAEMYEQIKARLSPDDGAAQPRLTEVRIVRSDAADDATGTPTLLHRTNLSEEAKAYLQIVSDRYLARYAYYRGRAEVIGLYYPVESAWREAGWGWLFLVRLRPDKRKAWISFLVRPAYAGRTDLQLRAPHSEQLAEERVLIVGVGALGSRLADGLARAGVGNLQLVDHDVVEPGNLARHVVGIRSAGLQKAVAVAEHLGEHSPLTCVEGTVLHLGTTALDGAAINGHGWMLAAVHDASLVVDAAADPAVSNYLSALCWAAEVPYVHVSATNGAWGGVVARIVPGQTAGCWACLAHHRADGTVPIPAADPVGDTLAPVGCVEPTFRGAAADLDTIALHAVRVTTDALAGSAGQGSLDADLHVATLRTARGLVPATWQISAIAVHPNCRQEHGEASRRGADSARAVS